MTESALDRRRAALQSRLREALLRLLGERLDLSDPGTLQLLRALLEKLKSWLGGQCLGSVAHADQWVALARVLGVSHGDGGVTLQLGSSHSNGPAGSATPVTSSLRPRQNMGLQTMALAAMANLGGQATTRQVTEEMARMPGSSGLSSAESNKTATRGASCGSSPSRGTWGACSSPRRCPRSKAASRAAVQSGGCEALLWYNDHGSPQIADHIVAKTSNARDGPVVRDRGSVAKGRHCLQSAARDGVSLLH